MKEKSAVIDSPAKINLCLAIIGKRADGYHNLLSVVAKLNFGDTVEVSFNEGEDRLEIVGIPCPLGAENLIFKTLHRLRQLVDIPQFFSIKLIKRIPLGAGLGGGSSNAVAVLKAINCLLDDSLSQDLLFKIASEIGADCPLFLYPSPVLIEGIGNIIRTEGLEAWRKFSKQKILIFKPSFSMSTPYAYSRVRYYTDLARASELIHHPKLMNDFESIVFEEFPILGNLMHELREERGFSCLLSGSGSACFILEDPDRAFPYDLIKSSLGAETFMIETSIE